MKKRISAIIGLLCTLTMLTACAKFIPLPEKETSAASTEISSETTSSSETETTAAETTAGIAETTTFFDDIKTPNELTEEQQKESMRGLDLVKAKYAPSYIKSMNDDGTYIYGDMATAYVLEFDSLHYDEGGKIYYSFHQYEMVEDDHDTGDGHTVTLNWYTVYEGENEIIPMF